MSTQINDGWIVDGPELYDEHNRRIDAYSARKWFNEPLPEHNSRITGILSKAACFIIGHNRMLIEQVIWSGGLMSCYQCKRCRKQGV